ncbi:MAG: trigger factor [Patescibacteria group bacterium]
MPGFRKGAAPKHLAAKYISPETLYDKTGRKLLPDLYKELVEKEKIQPVTTPAVELLEAKENEPWKFKVKVAEIPDS